MAAVAGVVVIVAAASLSVVVVVAVRCCCRRTLHLHRFTRVTKVAQMIVNYVTIDGLRCSNNNT